jgi:hypothetical protein
MIAARISAQQLVVLIGTAQVLVQLGAGAGLSLPTPKT